MPVTSCAFLRRGPAPAYHPSFLTTAADMRVLLLQVAFLYWKAHSGPQLCFSMRPILDCVQLGGHQCFDWFCQLRVVLRDTDDVPRRMQQRMSSRAMLWIPPSNSDAQPNFPNMAVPDFLALDKLRYFCRSSRYSFVRPWIGKRPFRCLHD